jgi:3-ketosteroid 9alpha-monooxygenase subunit A
MKRFPFPGIAIGWFQVAYSDEIGCGEVTTAHYFGRELIVWRDELGVPHVMDAYCPHLGAHLGVGGRVEGVVLRCPFHGWKFDGSGRCVEIPYSPRINRTAVVRSYPSLDRNGLLMCWHDPCGREPAWDLPEVPEYLSDEFTSYRRERWQIRTTWQELGENLLDVAHLAELHGLPRYSDLSVREEGPIRRVVIRQPFDTPVGTIEGTIESENYGPGFAIARFSGNVCMVSAVTAIDNDNIDVRFSFMSRKIGSEARTRRIGDRLINELIRQIEQDIQIWESKAYVATPALAIGDGPIIQWRSWASQFYIDESIDPTLGQSRSSVSGTGCVDTGCD